MRFEYYYVMPAWYTTNLEVEELNTTCEHIVSYSHLHFTWEIKEIWDWSFLVAIFIVGVLKEALAPPSLYHMTCRTRMMMRMTISLSFRYIKHYCTLILYIVFCINVYNYIYIYIYIYISAPLSKWKNDF